MTQPACNRVVGTDVPEHVPQDVVIDYDQYHPVARIDDLQAMWVGLREKAPRGIFWTPRNGGHWVALAGPDISRVQEDYEHFSHSEIFIPPNTQRTYPQAPLEMDPPQSTPFRRILLPPLLPNMMPLMEVKIREAAIELINGIAPRGHCEFMRDFASILPVSIFLGMMGFPLSDREMLIPLAEGITKSDSPEKRGESWRGLEAYVKRYIDERRGAGGIDCMSRLVNADIGGGKTMNDREAISMCSSLLLGGLDTVANMLGFFALFLAKNPTHRHQLIDHPELLNKATEELVRRHALVASGRRVVKDTELSGVRLKKGDMIQIPNALYGLDPSIVDDPMTVNFSRERTPHAAFGSGVHVCPGQHLARRELRIFLEEWLGRIPDFHITPGTTPFIVAGMVGGPAQLELSWAAVQIAR
jgi:cytochrome P450